MKLLFTLFLLAFSATLFAQPNITDSIIVYNKICKSRSFYEQVLNYKESNSLYSINSYGNLSTPGGIDSKVFKLNYNYDTLWSKKYGGSEDDELSIIKELPNGHLLLGGTTSSNDGDVPYGHTYSAKEIWVLEIDTMGNIIKGNTFGGSWGSGLLDLYITPWGEVIACGATNAFDFDFNHSMGQFEQDGWIAKLDTNYHIQWVKYIEGVTDDATISIASFDNKKFYYTSITGDSSIVNAGANAKGEYDLLLTCMDSSGTTLWRKRYGGSKNELNGIIILDSTNYSIYTVGATESEDKDIAYKTGIKPPGSVELNNIWILKTDTFGTILQSKAYGDKSTDSLHPSSGMSYYSYATLYDNHLWVFGSCQGGGGDLAPGNNNGFANAWIGKIDSQANLRGKFTITGNGHDEFRNPLILNGNLFATGGSGTYNNISNNYSCDTSTVFAFYLKLNNFPQLVEEYQNSDTLLFSLYPNPSQELLNISFNKLDSYKITVFNLLGGIIYNQKASNKVKTIIPIQNWSPGIYTISIYNAYNQMQSAQFLKN